MSRHLYDIEKIMDTEFGKSIEDRELYENVVRLVKTEQTVTAKTAMLLQI